MNYICLQILNYLDKEWSARKSLEENPEELSVWTFEAFDEDTNAAVTMVRFHHTPTQFRFTYNS